jgi:di- and tripeptidase
LLFFGCQNTSIQWYDFDQDPQSSNHIDGGVPLAVSSPRSCKSYNQKTQFFKLFHDLGLDGKQQHFIEEEEDLIQCVIRTNNVHSNAHDGYVYCMAYTIDIPNLEGEVLITGSGDGNIKASIE